ncbi:4-hydroxyphenylpyruvate dioxygenase-like protein [Zootoca vivipara]|uniref:4-hydroxyphenylpyruvate dioxygenase-like protein n=1 Tax=Zootoca vivipara TaxID=8524 RepID=UPI001590B1FE|nr:4-hydroxyphenylpyruvate dioxygenase-like protein [Zootoca vivipara]XP_060132933.1 4-hydroxyphenylpyruvate dioxygenase-like protein [Zootoca vivipara]
MPGLLNRMCHIGFHVPEGQQLASNLVHQFGFELFAARVAEWSRQLAFRRGDAVFLVNERLKPAKRDALPVPSSGCRKDKGILYDVDLEYAVSTASNICFEAEDVPGISQSLQERGCQILIPPTAVGDENGHVTYSVVASIIGNVSHTLLDRSRYSGPFLPGFHMAEGAPKKFQAGGQVTHFDHVTYACPQGSSQAVLDWYKNCLGFQRFPIHQQDNGTDGYTIQGAGMGLRLTAMQSKGSDSTLLHNDCKIILAESLPEQKKNQVDTFLEQHGGSGIQHVALYTTGIIGAAAAMARSGANFFKPPLSYYSEKRKVEEIRQAGQNLQLLKDHGILLDTDLGGNSGSGGLFGKQYLMQIFTKPLFTEDTFFLELIERCGATGFGEGNIRALWRSVQNYMDQQV